MRTFSQILLCLYANITSTYKDPRYPRHLCKVVCPVIPFAHHAAILFFPLTVYLSFADTKKSARELARDDLIRVLTYKSGDAVNWLIERFNLDLSKVSRLGGHSEKRTHRGTQQFPGMTITYALMEKVNLFVLCVIGLGADGGLALARGYGSTAP